MDQHKQSFKAGGIAPKPQISRADRSTAEIVRKGITLQQIHGTEYAAQFLREKNVDVDVIMRVLLNLSAKRRHDDLLEVPAMAYPGRRN
ncbi:MAG: hypothetical protein V4695_07645 [Pseudomonadota bacterium]